MNWERAQLNCRTCVSPEASEHEDKPPAEGLAVGEEATRVADEEEEGELVAAEVKVAPVSRSQPRTGVKRMVMD